MAENLNDIFENFGNKSLEELGSSLLSRQEAINKEQAKEAKKSRRIGQALAIMGVGQKIFKNSYNKRMKELDKLEPFLISNNEQQTKDIQLLGRFMQYMPDAEWNKKNKDKSEFEKTKLFLEEYDAQGMINKVRPAIDSMLEKSFRTPEEFNVFKAKSTDYDTAFDSALHTMLNDYFTINSKTNKSNYLSFEDELKTLFNAEPDMDRLELFKRARNLKTYDLTNAEKKLIAERKALYRNRGFRETFKDGLKQIGILNEENGGINLFKNIDEVEFSGTNLDEILNNLDIGGIVIGAVDETLSKYLKTGKSTVNLVRSNENLMNNAKNYIRQFDTNIKDKRLYNETNSIYKLTQGRKSFSRYTDDIIANEFQFNEWAADVGGLANLFKQDKDFAERVYVGGLQKKNLLPDKTEDQTKLILEFRKNLEKNDFRHYLAIAITAQQGFHSPGFKKPEYYDLDTDEKIIEQYSYDRFKGSIPTILGEGIKFNKDSNRYEIDNNWSKMKSEHQSEIFKLNVRTIINASSKKVTAQEKIIMLENLFENVPNPENLTLQEYIKMYFPDNQIT